MKNIIKVWDSYPLWSEYLRNPFFVCFIESCELISVARIRAHESQHADSHNSLLMDDSPEKIPEELRNNSIHPPPLLGLESTADSTNEDEQMKFFEKLSKHFDRKYDSSKYDAMESTVKEKNSLYAFLEKHGKSHMGWRSCARNY